MVWGSVAAWVGIGLSLLLSVLAYWRTSAREDDNARHELERRVVDLDRKVVLLETRIESLPTDVAIDKLTDSMNKLHVDVSHITGKFEAMSKHYDSVSNVLQQVNSYLLNQGHHK